jgi:diaminohydroxyphosphoribosylaminopyrimidine deaminase/5-amino-6-(5-phosphoribosylamino)uracil reductase
LKAGIGRVVAAMEDPFPQVAGKGAALLRSAGVVVEPGVLEREARRLNAPYRKLLTTGRPYVHAKWAMTLDGKIATRTGDSRWISGEASRRRVHDLRGRMDAVLVGLGTVLSDDPLLTARPPGPRIAVRIVLDSQGRLPRASQLVRTAREFPTLVVTAGRTAEDLRALGVDVLPLPGEGGRPSIGRLLDELGRRRMTNVLVEGGSRVLGSFHDAGEIDEIHAYVAPRMIGGGEALTPVGGVGTAKVADGLSLDAGRVEMLDGDVLFHAWRADRGP